MRLLHLTAGAGGMYCGTCLRDNALAAELMQRGHDVSLLPVYTPTRTDETNVSQERVFFGGLSVYLQQHVPLLRHTPAFLDALWDIPALIRAAAGRGVSVDPRALGELTVSTLRGEEGFQAKEVRKLVRYLERRPPFDLIVLPVSLLIGLAPPLKRALGRPVVCTLQGEDFFLDGLSEEHRRVCKDLIRRHAPHVEAFIATSDYYAGFMAGYLGLERQRIHTVPVGIRLEGHEASPPRRSGPWTLGYFARLAPEKGLHLLAEAYRMLRREMGLPPSRLRAAGYLAREQRGYLAEIERKLSEAGLRDEFRYEGEVDRAGKIAFLRELDVLSVPSPYAEPKGLYLLEAMASGVPWVQPCHGSFIEIHRNTGGGLLFEPNDARDLAAKLLRLANDRGQAAELGRRGAEGVRKHYSAARMGEKAVEVYAKVLGPPASGGGLSPALLVVEDLGKQYATPRGPLAILQGVSFTLAAGQALCVIGPSGSGKSTLLNILGGLEPPDEGTLTLHGRNPYGLPEAELAAFRNREVGFVFQEHCLLPQCSALENVLVPSLVAPAGDHVNRARELLARVGLADRLDHRPAELSGGEKQRVALARALVLRPRLLLCDEPTGNLDAAAASSVADLLLEMHGLEQAMLVLVTHSAELAGRFADRRRLNAGRLEPA